MTENTPKKYDPNMVRTYLKALTGTGEYSEAVTFQTFDDKGINQRLAGIRHLKRNTAYLDKLAITQEKGAGIFVMVNKGDGKGRSANNVVEVRAFFVDLDGSPWEPAAEMLRPHIRVESSPGRYHLYWLVSDCSLDQFKPIQQAIARKYDGDPKCVDLARVLRVPGFIHQKYEPVMTKLIEVNNLRRYTTQQILDGLQLDMGEVVTKVKTAPAPAPRTYEFMDIATGEMHNLNTWAAKNADFDIVSAIDPQYKRGDLRDGKQHIQCPFEDQHTDQGQDHSTFAANAAVGYPSFTIHCEHAHCDGRDRLEYLLTMLEKGWLTVDQLQPPTPAAGQMKRPPYINYRALEIAADLVKQPLQPEEFRILLHLMHTGWVAHDGTLPDDNWTIARVLGLSEDRWVIYRDTLLRSGWLLNESGRLFNPIAQREYDIARAELHHKIIGGKLGGDRSAEKRQKDKVTRQAYLQG